MEREWRTLCLVVLISWTHWSLASTESLLSASCEQPFTAYTGDFYGCLTDGQDYLTLTDKSKGLCQKLDIFVISDINVYLSRTPRDKQHNKPCIEQPGSISHFQYKSSCLMGTKGQAFKDFIYPFFTSFSGKNLNTLNLEAKLKVPVELQLNNTYIDIDWYCIPDNPQKLDVCQPHNNTDGISQFWLYLNNENTNFSQCSCNVRSNSTNIQIKTLDVRLNGSSLQFSGADNPLRLSASKLYWKHDNPSLIFTDNVDIELSGISPSLDQIVVLEVTGFHMTVSCGPSVPKPSTSPQNSHKAEFKLWYVIIISLAGVLVIILVTVVIICCCRRRKNMSREKELEVVYAEPFEHLKGKDSESKHQAGRAPKPCHSDTTESLLPPDYFELEKPLPPNNNVGRQDVYNHLREEEKPLPENIYDTTENEYSTLTRVNPKVIDNVYDV